MMIFNEAQTRRLLATFKYMGHSLENALRATTGEANDQAVCPEYVLDVPSAQQVALKEQLARFRDVLRLFIVQQQIAVKPSTSALATIKTALEFVQISLDEMCPKGLSGYGALSPEGATEIRHLIDELSRIAVHMMMVCNNTGPLSPR
jgi:hypothetical protein